MNYKVSQLVGSFLTVSRVVKAEDEEALHDLHNVRSGGQSQPRRGSARSAPVSGNKGWKWKNKMNDVCKSEENASGHQSEMSTLNTKSRGRVDRPVVKSTIRKTPIQGESTAIRCRFTWGWHWPLRCSSRGPGPTTWRWVTRHQLTTTDTLTPSNETRTALCADHLIQATEWCVYQCRFCGIILTDWIDVYETSIPTFRPRANGARAADVVESDVCLNLCSTFAAECLCMCARAKLRDAVTWHARSDVSLDTDMLFEVCVASD